MLLDGRETEVLKLLEQGLSIEKMSKSLGVSFTAVRNFLNKKQLQTKARYSDVKSLIPDICDLKGRGYTNVEISRKTGVNLNTVGHTLKGQSHEDLHVRTIKTLNLPFKVISKIDGRSRLYECEQKHQFVRATNNFLQNPICPECAPRSAAEDKAYQELSAIIPLNRNFKIPDTNVQIDFYNPTLKLGIEYNGEYWHSDKFRDKNYHQNKMLAAERAGITLLQFWGKEFEESLPIIKSMIRARAGIGGKKYFARKLTIKEVSKIEEKAFFKANHLQKHTPSIKCFGLYAGDELLTALSLRKTRESLEIARYATKLDCQVVGGFTRMLTACISFAKSIKIKTLMTYANGRYSQGNTYLKAGMRLVKLTSPDFSWLKNGVIYNRRASWNDVSFDAAQKVYGTGHYKFEMHL
jgi:DNA-binding CsgD family transcriptional regulator